MNRAATKSQSEYQDDTYATGQAQALLSNKTRGLHTKHYFRYLRIKRSLITSSVFLLGFSLQYALDVLAELVPVSRASTLIYLVNLIKGLVLAITHMLLLQLVLWPLNCWKWRQTIIDAKEIDNTLGLDVPTYCHARKALQASDLPQFEFSQYKNNPRFVLSLILFPLLGMGVSVLAEFLQNLVLNVLPVDRLNAEVMLAAAAKGPLLAGISTGFFYLLNRSPRSKLTFSHISRGGEPLTHDAVSAVTGSPRSGASGSASGRSSARPTAVVP